MTRCPLSTQKAFLTRCKKNTSGSKADRRNAIELAIIRDTMSALGSQVRWVPHGRMPADAMTKIDPARGNLALSEMLRRGSLCLMDEEGHMSERQLDLSLKSRSRKKCLEELLKSEERGSEERKRETREGEPARGSGS